jgi:hypothetical protein
MQQHDVDTIAPQPPEATLNGTFDVVGIAFIRQYLATLLIEAHAEFADDHGILAALQGPAKQAFRPSGPVNSRSVEHADSRIEGGVQGSHCRIVVDVGESERLIAEEEAPADRPASYAEGGDVLSKNIHQIYPK